LIDHFVLGVSDLEHGIGFVERLTGVRPAVGGRHESLGTWNALLALGERQYLELLAPDPTQERLVPPLEPLRCLVTPTLAKWAVATHDIEAGADFLERYGVGGPIESGSRSMTDGSVLAWRQVGFLSDADHGFPFLIQWAEGSVHPSEGAPGGCTLRSTELRHPAPERLQAVCAALGVDALVRSAAAPALVVVLDTPAGEVTLRS